MADSKRKQRQRSRQAAIQQATTLDNMQSNSREVGPPINSYLSSLEEQIKHQTSNTKDLQAELEQMKAEKEALQDQLQVEKYNNDQLTASLEMAKQDNSSLINLMETERCRFEEEKNTILKQSMNYTNSCIAQLNYQVEENRKLKVEMNTLNLELQSAKQLQAPAKNNVELESYLEMEKAQTQKLHHELKKMEETIQQQKEMQDFHQAQLEDQKAETARFAADLKKTEDLLQTERHLFEEEKEEMEKHLNSCLAQLNNQVDENRKLMASLEEAEEDKTSLTAQLTITKATQLAQLEVKQEHNKNLVAALKQAEQQLDSHQIQWKDEKSSVLQMLQDKEQEWQQNEISMRTQLEDLQRQINEKKNKKKWYRKLF
ncbi:centrosomal protein of 83 kDa-like [Centropristis striata]|uniref:centrosomal protein of 83 kDa-like n=1 Tax=Centropristis striata TaxID=184440 RepID=UPI0027DF7B86|nr:centrosomal protein of 83 kDa-like [Centropristis striata]